MIVFVDGDEGDGGDPNLRSVVSRKKKADTD